MFQKIYKFFYLLGIIFLTKQACENLNKTVICPSECDPVLNNCSVKFKYRVNCTDANITQDTCQANKNLCIWNTNNCTGNVDNCKQQYSSQIECQQATDQNCTWVNTDIVNECWQIDDILNVSCNQNLSAMACKNVQTEACQYIDIDSNCKTFNSSVQDCEQAYNFQACIKADNKTKQCSWVRPDGEKEYKCVQYMPDTCKGDPGRPTIQKICLNQNQRCKWQNIADPNGGTCLDIESTDSCQDGNYQLNKQACINLGKLCTWNGATKQCKENNEGNQANCSNGQNKYSCQRSLQDCAFVDQCEPFDNYTHNCQDYVSKTACQKVVFPCGWNDSSSSCYWFEDNQHACLDAANEVACLIADREDQECDWNDTSLQCVNISNGLLQIDSFWQNWTKTNFDDKFIDDYIERKRNESIAEENAKKANQTKKDNTPADKKEDDQDEGQSIYLVVPIAILMTFH